MTNNTDYDYRAAMYDDIMQYIADHDIDICAAVAEDRDEIEQQLNDDLWLEDSVTGNASGSYTFCTYKAEEYLCHNYDLLVEACDALCADFVSLIIGGAEDCDVTIRCYLLPEVIADILDEAEENIEI